MTVEDWSVGVMESWVNEQCSEFRMREPMSLS